MSPAGLSIAVGIATTGRREILIQAVTLLANQTRLPDHLIICPAAAIDVNEDHLREFPKPVSIVVGRRGLPAQRNIILAASQDADVILFLDDDFFVDRHYLEMLESLFVQQPDVVGVTGTLIADGAQGPGLKADNALKVLCAQCDSAPDTFYEHLGTYGCNMAFRMRQIVDHGLLFDEKLPLYGWQEDIDFSLRVAAYGRVVKSSALRGVHLGIKTGRTSGLRFGYSQIVNPLYLVRKGSMPWRHAAKLMSRNFLANLAKSFAPEAWVDRRGRLRGNVIAMADVMRGRISPERVLDLK